jgi:hypothetical protein
LLTSTGLPVRHASELAIIHPHTKYPTGTFPGISTKTYMNKKENVLVEEKKPVLVEGNKVAEINSA